MKMMTNHWQLVASLTRWIGNVAIGFGAAARLLIGWLQDYPK